MNKNIGLSEVFEFDISDISTDFEELFGPSAQWDNFFTSKNWAEATNAGNQYLKSDSFKEKYFNLLKAAGTHMGLTEFFFQAQPTFRIQLPNTQSVAYHTDDISSGHGHGIINFWLPLCNLNQHNCLWTVDEKETKNLLDRFSLERWSLSKLDHEARKAGKPCLMGEGEVLCFSNRILHGAVRNESSNVRLSIDFRCLPVDQTPGTRILGVEYLRYPEPPAVDLKECTSVIFQSGGMSHIGHNAQRSVVNDFAIRNGFTIIRETSEWHKLHHYPTLMDIVEKDENMPILIFSKESFDVNSTAWSGLMKSLSRHKAPIWFCLENEKFEP